VRNGSLLETRDGDYIICRNNAPLVDAFISLLKQGKSASIMGKEFGNNLLSLIDRIENIDGLSLLLEEKELELSEKGSEEIPKNMQRISHLLKSVTL
jgi:hypothetical protein